MANADIVSGAKPVGYLDGSAWNGALKWFYCPATDNTAIGRGDFVKMGGTGTADGIFPTCAQAAAGDPLIGAAVAFMKDNPMGNTSLVGSEDIPREEYRPASSAMYVGVSIGKDVVYEIQEDSDGGALTVAEIGENADIVVGSVDTVRGLSGMEIDSSDHKTATAQLRLLGLAPRTDTSNAVGANAKWLVLINEYAFSLTAGV